MVFFPSDLRKFFKERVVEDKKKIFFTERIKVRHEQQDLTKIFCNA
jgi:hypothetical protein